MSHNERVYEIGSWPEVDGDVISSRNVKTVEGYVALNFEVASPSSFRHFLERSLCDGEVGDGSGGVNAIFAAHWK